MRHAPSDPIPAQLTREQAAPHAATLAPAAVRTQRRRTRRMRMDPDHQADAAADTTAYAGGCGGAGGDESWARALLRRGWDLSRKAALAGVAATAAPVLATPVIILSIAGVALSVPFAACLASLAVTDRLMGALLPSTPPQQPYNYTYDLGDTQEPEQELVDAAEEPPDQEEAPVFGHWSTAEKDTIVEQNERLGSLPLSLEPRLSEELVPLLANEQGDSTEGVFAIQTSGHEFFAQRDGEHKQNNDTSMEADSEYITMEAPSPGDVSALEAPVLLCDEDDNISQGMDDAQVPAEESVQELSESDNGNNTEDGTATTAVDVSSKEMLSPSPGVDAYATGLGNLGMPMLGNENDMLLIEGEGGVSVQIEGHDSHVSDSGNEIEQHKTVEIMPQHEINVSESPVPVPSKLEQEPAVKMALQEEMRDTNPVTGYRADVQLDVIAAAKPQSESLHSRREAAHELQEVTESIHAYDTLEINLTEGIVKDIDNKTPERVEHHGRGDMPSITTMDVSSKEMLSLGVDATGLSNLGKPMLGNEDNMILREGEGGVSVGTEGHDYHVSDSGNKTEQHKTIEDMPQLDITVYESPVLVPSRLEHDPAVEMAQQEETNDPNPVTGDEVDVQLDVIATTEPKNESLHSGHEASHELHVCDTLGSNLTEGIVKDSDNKTAKHVEHFGKESVLSTVPVDEDKDLISHRNKQIVSSICSGTTSVGKPHVDHPNRTTSAASKEHGKEEVVEDKCLTTEETGTLGGKMPNTDMAAQDDRITKSLVPDYQSTREDEVTVEMVLEEVTSRIDPVTGEVVEVQVDIIARESESRPMSDFVDKDLQVVIDAGNVGDKMDDNMKGISNTKVVDVEHEIGGGSSSVVTVTSVLNVDDDEDLMSSGSTPYVSANSDDKISVKGKPDLEHRYQTTGVGNKVKDRELETEMLVEDKDIYTEEQLREQLDTLRTITGYRSVPSLTLEGELAGLYIFVGVEPPHGSGDASSLTEFSTKLRFLKSIIGVE